MFKKFCLSHYFYDNYRFFLLQLIFNNCLKIKQLMFYELMAINDIIEIMILFKY